MVCLGDELWKMFILSVSGSTASTCSRQSLELNFTEFLHDHSELPVGQHRKWYGPLKGANLLARRCQFVGIESGTDN